MCNNSITKLQNLNDYVLTCWKEDRWSSDPTSLDKLLRFDHGPDSTGFYLALTGAGIDSWFDWRIHFDLGTERTYRCSEDNISAEHYINAMLSSLSGIYFDTYDISGVGVDYYNQKATEVIHALKHTSPWAGLPRFSLRQRAPDPQKDAIFPHQSPLIIELFFADPERSTVESIAVFSMEKGDKIRWYLREIIIDLLTISTIYSLDLHNVEPLPDSIETPTRDPVSYKAIYERMPTTIPLKNAAHVSLVKRGLSEEDAEHIIAMMMGQFPGLPWNEMYGDQDFSTQMAFFAVVESQAAACTRGFNHRFLTPFFEPPFDDLQVERCSLFRQSKSERLVDRLLNIYGGVWAAGFIIFIILFVAFVISESAGWTKEDPKLYDNFRRIIRIAGYAELALTAPPFAIAAFMSLVLITSPIWELFTRGYNAAQEQEQEERRKRIRRHAGTFIRTPVDPDRYTMSHAEVAYRRVKADTGLPDEHANGVVWRAIENQPGIDWYQRYGADGGLYMFSDTLSTAFRDYLFEQRIADQIFRVINEARA